MRTSLTKTLLGACAMAAALSCGASAEDAVPQGDTYDSIAKLPDWSGTWIPFQGRASVWQMDPNMFTPAWQAKKKAIDAVHAVGGDQEGRDKHCIFQGLPSDMAGPEVVQDFLFTPGRVTITDVQSFTRRIYTDGRKHKPGPGTFFGDSIGHWENRNGVMTLVSDTTNLDPGNELAYGLPGGKNMRVVEEFYLDPKDKTVLELDMTVYAPESLKEPWKSVTKYRRKGDNELTEWDCALNNVDVDATGNQTINLVPPDQRQ
jgi:hypothetical protein